MNGCRGTFTSLLVKMFTTEGMAFFAAGLSEVMLARFPDPSAASRTVTMPPPRALHETRSGRRVTTTNNAARLIVTAWENMSQNLRMKANLGREGTQRRARASTHYSPNGLVIEVSRAAPNPACAVAGIASRQCPDAS